MNVFIFNSHFNLNKKRFLMILNKFKKTSRQKMKKNTLFWLQFSCYCFISLFLIIFWQKKNFFYKLISFLIILFPISLFISSWKMFLNFFIFSLIFSLIFVFTFDQIKNILNKNKKKILNLKKKLYFYLLF